MSSRALVSAITIGLTIALGGCGKPDGQAAAEPTPAPSPSPANPLGTPAGTHTVRGVIVELPVQGTVGSELQVRHEAIDDWANAAGEVVGMNAMVMPFPLAKGVSLEGFAAGDIVEITFSVWWKPRAHWEAASIKKLPADTKLTFGRAKPAKPESPAGAPPANGGN